MKIMHSNKEKKTKISLFKLNFLLRRLSPSNDLLALVEIILLCRKIQPNIIHLNSSKAGVLGSLVKIFYRKPLKIVYTAHGWVFNEQISTLLKSTYIFLEYITSKLKDAVIVLSPQDEKDAQKKLRISTKKIHLVPLGISMINEKTILNQDDAKKELSKYTKQHVDIQKIWLGTIANFYNTKGVDILLYAIAKLDKKTKEKIQCIIIGDGPHRKKLEKIILQKGLTQIVHLTGNIDNAANLLPSFDLFILPSRKEGLPYVILEAMSSHIPVIASDVGGVSSLVKDKKNGLLTKSQDIEHLSKNIIYAIEHKKTLETLASQAYKDVQAYSLEKMIISTEKIYLTE